ncbi:MAG: hypothetical protein RL407_353 [Bacteroidota bacterium]
MTYFWALFGFFLSFFACRNSLRPRHLFLLFFLGTPLQSLAQVDSAANTPSKEWKVSGVIDLFYGYDFNQPEGKARLPFLSNHNRHNQVALNLGLVKLAYTQNRFRGNLALHAGSYSVDNYVDEPGVLKHVFEANVGVLLSKKSKVWLDAGVLPSHIGFESAISTDNWTLTRSILAENTPYFLTGGKLSFQPSDKWFFSALVFNGWQRITRVEGSTKPSFGTQVQYFPKDGVVLNWSTFLGSDDPDASRRKRYFSNLYGQFQVSDALGLIVGMDMGVQQQRMGSTSYDPWLSPIVIGQVKWNQRIKSAVRVEYYQDRTGIRVKNEHPNGFATTALSLNLDYTLWKGWLWRIEASNYRSRDQVFLYPQAPTATNFFLITSLAYRF